MKKQITIQVRPENFDRLDISCLTFMYGNEGTGQYSISTDCPLFRAIKNAGHNIRRIDNRGAEIGRVTFNSPDNHCDGVEAIRERLLAGEPFVTVTFTKI